MTLAVFVAPHFSPAASQIIEAAVSLTGVPVAVVAQEPREALSQATAARLAGHWRVNNVLDADELETAMRGLARDCGPVSCCFAAYEQLQVPLAIVRERLGVPGLSAQAAHNFRDKARMKDLLRAAGVPVARHALIRQPEEAEAFSREVGFPIVVKPPAGAGAVATHRVRTVAELAGVLHAHHMSDDAPLMAEEFLHGSEHSLETVSIGGRAVWHSLSHYDPTPLHVLENQWIQWCVLVPREIDDRGFDDIKQVNSQALAALGMETGVSHCEWFRRADGSVAISEIAARPPGAQITTMMSRANDFDFVRAWVVLMVHGTFVPPIRRYAVGTVYLRGQGAGRIHAVHGLEAVRQEFGGLVCDVRLPSVGATPTASYEGDGFIMLRHPDTRVVAEALQRVAAAVRVQLA